MFILLLWLHSWYIDFIPLLSWLYSHIIVTLFIILSLFNFLLDHYSIFELDFLYDFILVWFYLCKFYDFIL